MQKYEYTIRVPRGHSDDWWLCLYHPAVWMPTVNGAIGRPHATGTPVTVTRRNVTIPYANILHYANMPQWEKHFKNANMQCREHLINPMRRTRPLHLHLEMWIRHTCKEQLIEPMQRARQLHRHVEMWIYDTRRENLTDPMHRARLKYTQVCTWRYSNVQTHIQVASLRVCMCKCTYKGNRRASTLMTFVFLMRMHIKVRTYKYSQSAHNTIIWIPLCAYVCVRAILYQTHGARAIILLLLGKVLFQHFIIRHQQCNHMSCRLFLRCQIDESVHTVTCVQG